MAFQPKSGNHAIIEAVYGVIFTRLFSQPEIETVVKSHSKWKTQLPRLGRSQVIRVDLGDEPPPPEVVALQPASGATFDRIKPDGTLELRLKVDDNAILFNDLNYEGWAPSWERALTFLKEAALDVTGGSENYISSILFQVVNLFEWEDSPSPVQMSELFSEDCDLIPSSIWKAEDHWHLYQGWFRKSSLPLDAARLLQKPEITYAKDAQGKAAVKLDLLHKLDLASPEGVEAFFSPAGGAEIIFNFLHDANKAMVRNLLTSDMAKRINLDG